MKQHICFIQYNLRGGGAERKVCTLANFFAENGYEVEIGLFGRNIVAYELDNRVKLTFIDRCTYEYKNWIEKLGYALRFGCISAVAGVVGIFSKRAGDKLRAHFWKDFNYTQPIKSYILHRPDAVFITMIVQSYNEIMRVIEGEVKLGKILNPYIVMECSNPTPGLDSNELDDERRNRYYPLAARCVTMTQGCVDYYNETIQKKCVVIPNPLRPDLPQPYMGKRRNVVTTYCRLHPAKNLPLLLSAFTSFHKRYSEYTLEIYGEGELLSSLNEQIIHLGIEGCAHIYPFDPHIHSKIRDCAMFVSSSDWEGFPNSVMEALAIGLPTISTDCDFGPRDMIRDYENGLLVPVGDVQALVNAMTELAENPDLAERLSKESVKVRETYDVDRIGQQWLDLIENVAKERGLA